MRDLGTTRREEEFLLGDAVDTIQSKSALFGPWGKSDAPYVAFLVAWHNAAQPFALRPWAFKVFFF